MKNILEEIVAHKKKEVQQQMELVPTKLLERSIYFGTDVVSMKQYLLRDDKVGIIAEIKRASPSTGIIKQHIDVEQLSISYMQAGASALSVLTDSKFFGGSDADLEIARKFNYCPILRKDFIVDEYQLVQAKSIGADCILLIAACLSPTACQQLAAFAKSLGLEVLLEVHDQKEIETHFNPNVDLLGVNNRDLRDFTTDINTSIRLAEFMPKEVVKVSESGITNAAHIIELKKAGFSGFLIGGHFMKHELPGVACRELIAECTRITA